MTQPYDYKPPRPRKRHRARNGILAGGGALVAVIAISAGLSSCGSHPAAPAPSVKAVTAASAPAAQAAPATSAPAAPAKPAAPAMTAGQQQAVDSAQSYLSDGSGFSAAGLLQQLTSSYGEGFSKADAEFAIAYLKPDWDAQAVEAAQGYVSDGEGFSRSGLIQQLTSSYGDGFTEAQAVYAVGKVGM